MTPTGDPTLLLALDHARHHAAARGHDRVATGHLLLGLLEVSDGAALLRAVGLKPAALRGRVLRALPPAGRARAAETLPYSANAARALEAAARESAAAGQAAVHAAHLLVALSEAPAAAADHLRALGATPAALRRAMAKRARGTDAALAFLRVADDGTPVYRQIVDQVREAVAAGRLRPDDRLPPVRQLAASLEVAPGTTARAYQELEQLGVVVTDGARGTRVAQPRPVEIPRVERTATLIGLLRPVAVAAAYLGASADEVKQALDHALADILPAAGRAARAVSLSPDRQP